MRFKALVLTAATAVLVVCASATESSAQRGGPPAANGQEAAGLSPQELERHFDAYVMLQAQEALQLSEQQFERVVPRLRAVQQARRREVQQQRRAVADLARLLRAKTFDEARAREGLRRLREVEERTCSERQSAYARLDEVLDTAQRARFRVFEEQVERRKVELVVRARQAAARQERQER